MTPQEMDQLTTRIATKLSFMSEKRLKEITNQATITSGFSREILRLTARDVKFMTDCGIKVE